MTGQMSLDSILALFTLASHFKLFVAGTTGTNHHTSDISILFYYLLIFFGGTGV
jgi:hypothetical protein